MLTLRIYCLSEDYTPQNPSKDEHTKFPLSLKPIDFYNHLRIYFLNDEELRSLDKNNDVYIFTWYSVVKDSTNRAEIVAKIYELLTKNYSEEELKDNFIIKFYLVLPEAETFLVNNFDKINNYLDYIVSSSKEKMLNQLDKYSDLRIEMSKNLKPINVQGLSTSEYDHRNYDYLMADYLEYSLSNIINKNMDENKDEYQEEMINDIIESREEEYGDEIRNELDLVNKIMVDNDINMNNSEVLSCKYNGEELSPEEISEKLHSHTFPQYITQINIQDTLDDEYDIVTSKGTIHRSKGGKISIQ